MRKERERDFERESKTRETMLERKGKGNKRLEKMSFLEGYMKINEKKKVIICCSILSVLHLCETGVSVYVCHCAH